MTYKVEKSDINIVDLNLSRDGYDIEDKVWIRLVSRIRMCKAESSGEEEEEEVLKGTVVFETCYGFVGTANLGQIYGWWPLCVQIRIDNGLVNS